MVVVVVALVVDVAVLEVVDLIVVVTGEVEVVVTGAVEVVVAVPPLQAPTNTATAAKPMRRRMATTYPPATASRHRGGSPPVSRHPSFPDFFRGRPSRRPPGLS